LAPLWCLAFLASATATRAEVQIERTVMPFEAAPSSFAIGLPGGVSFCFDAVRGGVSYAWTGGFIDLASVRPGPGKLITPVKLLGPVAYRESGASPLRRGDPARVPAIEFKGYTLRADAIEFRYTVDGALVREEIRAQGTGAAAQLVRRFAVAGAADAKWWYVVAGQPPRALGPAGTPELKLEIPLGSTSPTP
jgi:hypothetical protein